MSSAQHNPIEELVIFGNPAHPPKLTDDEKKELRRLHLKPSHYTTPEEIESVREMFRKIAEIHKKYAAGNPSKFQQLEQKLVSESRARRYPLRSPGGLAAAIGRRKYGAKKFAEMAKRGRAHNSPDELADAEALYQEFHGRDPQEVVELQRSAAVRSTYVACGPLLAIGIFTPGMKLPSPTHWDEYPAIDFSRGVKENGDLKPDGVMLSANPEGTQLYAIGGDQNLDDCLDDFDVDTSKDLIALCDAAYVVYFDEKPHTGFQGVEYMHEFDQPRPVIGYDRLNKQIFFVGGRYEVKGNWLEH